MAVQAVTATASSVAISTKTRFTLCAFTTTAGLTFVFMLLPPAAHALGKVTTGLLAAAAVAGIGRFAFAWIAEPVAATYLGLIAAASVPISAGLTAAGVNPAGPSKPPIARAAQPLASALQAGGVSLDACDIRAVYGKPSVAATASCTLTDPDGRSDTQATFTAYTSTALMTQAYDTLSKRMKHGHVDHDHSYHFRHSSGRMYAVIARHHSEAVWWFGDSNVLVTMTRPTRNLAALVAVVGEYTKASYRVRDAGVPG